VAAAPRVVAGAGDVEGVAPVVEAVLPGARLARHQAAPQALVQLVLVVRRVPAREGLAQAGEPVPMILTMKSRHSPPSWLAGRSRRVQRQPQGQSIPASCPRLTNGAPSRAFPKNFSGRAIGSTARRNECRR
jgi:hypothetical protein